MIRPNTEYYELVPGANAMRGLPIADIAAAHANKVDYIAVRYGSDAIYVSFSGHSYDGSGNVMDASDPMHAPMDCAKCGER